MIRRSLLALLLVVSINVAAASTAFAATCDPSGKILLTIDPWYYNLCKENTDMVEIVNIPEDIVVLALNVISIAIQIGGYIAIGFVIYGGIRYITSNGDSNKVAGAKSTIINALVGLLIMLSAVAIIRFVQGSIL